MCMYLHLFHGRTSPDERLSDWGSDGPWIGPLCAVRTTYTHTLKLKFCNPRDAARFGLSVEQPWLHVREQMLLHAGVYYGEWVIEHCDTVQMVHLSWCDPLPPEHADTWLEPALMASYEDCFTLYESEVGDA